MTRTFQTPEGARKRAIPRWWRAGALAAALAAAAVLLTACGGGAPHVAASSSANAAGGQSRARQSGLLFAVCMRSHGVLDFPDPLPEGGFDMPRGVKQQPQFQSASEACANELPEGGASAKHVNIPEEVNFARCMRSHGITDFPDPMPGGGFDVPSDTSSPQFDAAAQACQSTGIHWNGP